LEWQAISSRLGRNNLSNEDIRLVRSILKECGAQAKVNVAIRDHLERAIEIVQKMSVSDEIKDLLVAFASYCVERKK
jgi:geranylgeranyl pyrophosphate synthase